MNGTLDSSRQEILNLIPMIQNNIDDVNKDGLQCIVSMITEEI